MQSLSGTMPDYAYVVDQQQRDRLSTVCNETTLRPPSRFLPHQYDLSLASAFVLVPPGDVASAAAVTREYEMAIAVGKAIIKHQSLVGGDQNCTHCAGFLLKPFEVPTSVAPGFPMIADAAEWFSNLSQNARVKCVEGNADSALIAQTYRTFSKVHVVPRGENITLTEECPAQESICAQCSTMALLSCRVSQPPGDFCPETAKSLLHSALRTAGAKKAMASIGPKDKRRETAAEDNILQAYMHTRKVCPFTEQLDPAKPWGADTADPEAYTQVHADFWCTLKTVMTGEEMQDPHPYAINVQSTTAAAARSRINESRNTRDSPRPFTHPSDSDARDSERRPTQSASARGGSWNQSVYKGQSKGSSQGSGRNR